MSTWKRVLVMGAAMGGCVDVSGGGAGVDPRHLPAYQTEAEKQNARYVAGDVALAATAPPPGLVSLAGEYEPVQELLVAIPALDESPTLQKLIAASSRTQATTVLVPDANVKAALGDSLTGLGADLSKITFVITPLEGIWVRDFGPIVVYDQSQTRRFIDFKYYPDRLVDDAVPTHLADSRGLPVHRPSLYLEGGNLQSDGQGVCITSEAVYRLNTGLTEAELKQTLLSYSGCQTTVVLPPIIGDGTGHVDMFAHFYGPRKVFIADIPAAEDAANSAAMNEAARRLEAAGVAVTRIPMGTGYTRDEYTYYRTYTNAVPITNAVIVPVYAQDSRGRDQALQAFAQAYPGRTIIPIESDDLLDRAGALHCVTMQVAAASRFPTDVPPPTVPVPSSPSSPPSLVGTDSSSGQSSPSLLGCAAGGGPAGGVLVVLVVLGQILGSLRRRRARG